MRAERRLRILRSTCALMAASTRQPMNDVLMTGRDLLLLGLLLPAACAINDSRIAHRAQQRLIGLSEVDLESCLGPPDQHSTFGRTDILTYYATSTSSTSFSVPVLGGIGLSNGAYCHATFRVDSGYVTRILYSGEKNATLAPDAYCAPIMWTCLIFLDQHPQIGRADKSAAASADAWSDPPRN